MRSRELNRQLQRLEALVHQTGTASGGSLELQAHWGRYLCVLVAGFLENAVEELYGELARNSASSRSARYISRSLSRVRSPKADKFMEIAAEFDPSWADELSLYLNANGRKQAIDGIIAQRHLIAHGRDSSITVAKVYDYLCKCLEVLEYIETQCSP